MKHSMSPRLVTTTTLLAAGMGLLSVTSASASLPLPVDKGFGTQGHVVDFATGHVEVRASAASGVYTVVAGAINNGVREGVFLARYNAAGALDPSFGIGGVVKDFTTGVDSSASALS